MRAAVGFSIHTGWAVLVVVSAAGEVLLRRRIELAERDQRFVYHAAVGKPGAARSIQEATRVAVQRAGLALRALLGEHALAAAAVPPPKRALPDLEAILRSHPLIHTAEGELYRRAVEIGCREAGLRVVSPAPLQPEVGKLGPPWGKDQRDAAALAFGALAAR